MGGVGIGDLNRRSIKPSDVKAVSPQGDKQRWWQQDISFTKGIPDKIKEGFYLELHTLLSAGVDVRSAIALVAEQQKKARFTKLFGTIQADIISGATFSAALQQHNGFSNYEIFSIQIGEETGRLPVVLKDLYQYFQKKIRQRRQIISALTYPAIVISVAIIAVVFMANFIVPMFSSIFQRFGNGELPAITQMVVSISQFTRRFAAGWLLLILLCIALIWSQRNKPWYRKNMSALVLKLPGIGNLVSKIYLARMANSLALLIGARVPMLQAIQLVQQMIPFYPVQVSLVAVAENILKGQSLHSSLAAHKIYPAKMVALIKVGEEVNQLDVFFEKIHQQYTEEVAYDTSLLSSLMEPLIIVFLGLVVGVILIAMYLPLFKMGQGF
jgi:type IV pilus assembly protein PilC